jgi:hypothetical protein
LSRRSPISNVFQAPEAWEAGGDGAARRQPSTRAQRQPSTFDRIRRSYVFGLTALAIVVAVCGLGYRLAYFMHRASPANRVGSPRFWMEPRSNPVAANHSVSGQVRLAVDSQALPAEPPDSPRVDAHAAPLAPVVASRPATLLFLIPFRSPPPVGFSLA